MKVFFPKLRQFYKVIPSPVDLPLFTRILTKIGLVIEPMEMCQFYGNDKFKRVIFVGKFDREKQKIVCPIISVLYFFNNLITYWRLMASRGTNCEPPETFIP